MPRYPIGNTLTEAGRKQLRITGSQVQILPFAKNEAQTMLPKFQQVAAVAHGDSSFRRQYRSGGQNRRLPPESEIANTRGVGDAGMPTGSLRKYADVAE